MRREPRRRTALLNLLTLTAIILASGLASCCSVGHKVNSQPVSANIHSSFLFVLNKTHIRDCSGGSCKDGVALGTGSGFAIANVGDATLVATAGHLCVLSGKEYKQELSVIALGGKHYEAEIVMVAPQTDTCVLAVQNAKIAPLKVANKAVERGERVYALSAPYGIFDSNMIAQFEGFYAGHTSKQSPPGGFGVMLDLDAYTIPSRPGSSGGPIVNSRGEVVGMVVMAHPGFETFTLSPRQDSLQVILEMVVGIGE